MVFTTKTPDNESENDMALTGKDVLTLAELDPSEVRQVLDAAKMSKNAWAAGNRNKQLEGKAIALVFMKPSMRTRVSFEVACGRLGAQPIVLGPGEFLSRGESLYDTAKVMERYVDAIVIRTFKQSEVQHLAVYADVPVVNALTDDYHPCQVLADLLTVEERLGRLDGATLAYVGDGNNLTNTLAIGCAQTGMNFRAAYPEGYEPLEDAIEMARKIAGSTGATIELTHDPRQAVEGADVVYTDTWASMGQEEEHDRRVKDLAGYRVTPELMEEAADGAIFLHCLPAHRGEEVVDAVIDADYSAVFDEAENRLHVQKTLLSLILR